MAIRLPSYIPPSAKLNRPEAGKLNELKTQSQDITFSGYNEVVPVVYGEQIVAGPIIAGPPTGAVTSLRYAIAITYVGDAPVEGITHVIVNGVKHAATAIPSANSPAVFTKDGISFRIYNGMQTIVDSTLKTTFGASFDDSFNGVAYAVITIPQNQSSSIEFDSAVKFVVRGKKCLDPRDSVKRWTENPSLHLADYVTDPNCLGRSIEGVVECADWNDSLYSGLPRARSGLVINAALKAEDILDLMCTYAECLWSYEGESVRVIPDKPIDGVADTIKASQIKQGTLTFTGSNQDQIPTAVSIFFSDRDAEGEWGSLPARAQIAEHEVLGTVSSLSDVQMPGIYRRIEGDRRAWQRLMRLQSPGKIAWQMYAAGIQYQAGDVLRLPDIQGLSSMRVRLISQPEMVAAGIYQIHAEPYKSDDYPKGSDGAVAPIGAVMFFDGTVIPEGFEDISPSENLPIYGVGLGSSTGVAAHSGQVPSGSVGYTLQTSGGHGFTDATGLITSPSGDGPKVAKQGIHSGAHAHSGSFNFGLAANSEGVKKRSTRLILSTSESVSSSYQGMFFLAVNELPTEGVVEKVISPNHYLSASGGVTETPAKTTLLSYSSTSGDHSHESTGGAPVYATRSSSNFNPYIVANNSLPTAHNHATGASVDQKLKTITVAAYQFEESSIMPVGSIIGFAGESTPLGWALCDGTNDTPDFTGRSPMLKNLLEAGVLSGEDSVSVTFPASGGSGSVTHKHGYSQLRGPYVTGRTYSHQGSESHNHPINVSPQTRNYNYKPKHFALCFIQYKGD